MYRVKYGMEVTGGTVQSKVPETADDLQFSAYSLKLPQTRLDQLAKSQKTLRNMKEQLIFETEKIAQQSIASKVKLWKTKADGLKATCETIKCVSDNPLIPIYRNRCSGCCQSSPDGPLQDIILTLRNLDHRLTFLQEQISSSLANTLSQEELVEALSEAETLTSFII